MTTKELMIGDIIGVTHEELGLVYAKVEYINEAGDLCVRADNPYMDGGYECTSDECEPVEIKTVGIGRLDMPLVVNSCIELDRRGLGITVTTEDGPHIIVENCLLGSICIYECYLHKLQQAIRTLGGDDKAVIR